MIEHMFDHGRVDAAHILLCRRTSHAAHILHADLDSFYASVEQRDDPRLRGRPVAVGGGVVLAASYEAKAFGVHTPMGGRAAAALCPGLIFVPPRFTAYVEASRRVFDIFRDTTPLVEGISIDEAFLDVGGLRRLVGSPLDIATALRLRVRDEVGLPISVGIARTKYLAKVASAVSKPDGLPRVPPEAEEAFLHPLPVERLWGVGAVTAGKLHADGVRTVGQLAARSEGELAGLVGKASGRHLWALANLLDPRPVEVGRRRGSVGAQRALGRGRRTLGELEIVLIGLVDKVARRLRRGERIARTLTLRLRFDDMSRVTRSATIPSSTGSTAAWLDTGRRLLHEAWPMVQDRGCTLLGVSVSGLSDARWEQLELPFDATAAGEDRGTALDRTLDRLKERYGAAAVTRGVLLGRDSGLEMPQLPDPGPARASGQETAGRLTRDSCA